ncbi:ECF transporter S component [Terrilactibacillus sp. S3-3]|nr:ECF transporter S component [Terrilactibacillus sp. S3-3]
MLRVRKMTVLSLLTAAAVAGRLLIHGVNIQPATLIIILTGWFFGWKMGLTGGLMVAFVSDLVLGLGYWTPFQMTAWGVIGLISSFIPKNKWMYIGWLLCFGLFIRLDHGFILFCNVIGYPYRSEHVSRRLIFRYLSCCWEPNVRPSVSCAVQDIQERTRGIKN